MELTRYHTVKAQWEHDQRIVDQMQKVIDSYADDLAAAKERIALLEQITASQAEIIDRQQGVA